MTFPDDEALIRAALLAAAQAGAEDVPIGAVIYAADGTELARAANARERLGDPTAHAEVLALREAAAKHGDGWRLEGATLAVTVEPCTMCAGALVLARVVQVVLSGEHQHLVDGQRDADCLGTFGRNIGAELHTVDPGANVFAELFDGDPGVTIDTSCFVVTHPRISTIPAPYAQG